MGTRDILEIASARRACLAPCEGGAKGDGMEKMPVLGLLTPALADQSRHGGPLVHEHLRHGRPIVVRKGWGWRVSVV